MKATFKFNFVGVAYIYIFAILLLVLATSCTSGVEDEPAMPKGQNSLVSNCTLDSYANDTTATILVLHKDPDYGKYKPMKDRLGVSWKAFPNSEENIDLYLKGDGFMSVWKGENASNFTMGYKEEEDIAIIQPWPYIGLDGTVLTKDETANIYTIDFQGEQYYMFNPVVVNLPSQNPSLINYRNGKPIKYLTLFCDYVAYGSNRINNFEPEDEYFYMNSNLPLPEGGLERNKIYVYILDNDYNFFEYGRRAGNYAYDAASVYAASHPNDPDKYTLIEYNPATENYYRLH